MSVKVIKDDLILIRKAKPDLDEGIAFAHYFNEAAEGFFKSTLGERAFEIIADAYVKTNNEYSYENVVVIEYKGDIVGMASGYTYFEKVGFEKRILSEFKAGAKFRIRVFSLISKFLSRALGPRCDDEYYLQAIAISSEVRGKGLGQRLLNHSQGIAIEKGARLLSLDVSSKNENAISSYNKFGMSVASNWPNFLGIPPVFTRMVKKL